MPKAPVPATPLRTCRLFEPARYSQHYLACAYRQLVPDPRRRLPRRAGVPADGTGTPSRIVAS